MKKESTNTQEKCGCQGIENGCETCNYTQYVSKDIQEKNWREELRKKFKLING